MKKSSRIGAAVVATLALFGLTGCATVSVQAAVLDSKNATFAIQEIVTHEGFEQYLHEQENGSSQEIPTLDGSWSGLAGEKTQELEFADNELRIYEGPKGDRTLLWAGRYLEVERSDIGDFRFQAVAIREEALSFFHPEVPFIDFRITNGKLSYVPSEGVELSWIAKTFSRSEVKSTESKYDSDELCQLFKDELSERYSAGGGVGSTVECTDVDFAVTTNYQVGYGLSGVTSVLGVEISPEEARKLPFKFSVDPVYGDVVFEHRLVGLDSELVSSGAEWLDYVKDYRVVVSFPGAVSAASDNGVIAANNSVSWDYPLVKAAVENGKYTLKAAGRADATVNPVPFLVTAGGILFILLLLVYFSWKRFSPKTTAILSLIFSALSPIGLSLAIVAKKKARNNADGAILANWAIIVSGASIVFQLLVVILLITMAPTLVEEILGNFGLLNSAA